MAWTLLGISALGIQAALRVKGEKTDGFWVARGLVFLVGGLWELFELTGPLASVLLIVWGVSTLWDVVSRGLAH